MRLSKPTWRSTIVSISASDASSSTTRIRPLLSGSVWAPDGATAGSLMGSIVPARTWRTYSSVSVLLRLVGPGDLDAQVGGLVGGQLGELHTERVQVQTGDLLVEVLRQHVDADRVLLGLREDLDLGQHLVGEGVGHHERRVAGCVAEVHQTTLG